MQQSPSHASDVSKGHFQNPALVPALVDTCSHPSARDQRNRFVFCRAVGCKRFSDNFCCKQSRCTQYMCNQDWPSCSVIGSRCAIREMCAALSVPLCVFLSSCMHISCCTMCCRACGCERVWFSSDWSDSSAALGCFRHRVLVLAEAAQQRLAALQRARKLCAAPRR